ncbi:MAG: glycosyltransferase family 4 protein, partial [Verrucomicrobiota bacterium]|nr:glycosyltransferase family 4 protein [Verrucomicrobiota bacterium]
MKLAIVIPWFGRDLKGGAEQQAWQIASRFAAREHSVDVLTTCCRSHQDDWATNHWPPGATREPEGFTIQRFPVELRDRPAFERVCGRLQSLQRAELKPGVSPIPPEENAIFVHELIKSGLLLKYLEEHKRTHDWFIFLPYLYGPVLQGVNIVGARAALQPCLHDEAYAYLPEVAEAFRNAGQILFNSEGERDLALRMFGPGLWRKSTVVGEGVEASGGSRPEELAAVPRNGSERYVLYLGRKDAGKNVPMLVRAYQRFRTARPNSRLRLVLAGNGTVELNGNSAGVQDLGLVDEVTKEQLLRNCSALFQPSQNESYSRVVMEAWRYGRPVAAHSLCLATAIAVQSSGGGWLAEGETDWAGLFAGVDRVTEDELTFLGQRGQIYAGAFADWE